MRVVLARPRAEKSLALAILCPGQGGQYPAMFDLVAHSDAALEIVASVDSDLADAIISADGIFANRVAQPLICAATLARWEAIRGLLPRPMAVLGYSVGELAAYAIANIFSNGDCIGLARVRAALMDDAAPPGSRLLAITGMRHEATARLCAACGASIAIVNGDAHYVVGGNDSAIDCIEREANAQGASVVRLRVAVPAHTPFVAAAADAFRDALAKVKLRAPDLAVLAGVNGQLVRNADEAAALLASQIATTVQWQRCCEHAIERGASVFLELGPGRALSRMISAEFPDIPARSLDEFGALEGAAAWVRRSGLAG
ncbi:MAG TPA: acyltransferase domain-containing protein [Casimicrobiaceae bacterium]|nr:acyltransferase domain-containing protein [Casimicrobiaceae bacterium]